MRRIIAEDPNWTLAIVPNLTTICLQSIVDNFKANMIYVRLQPDQQEFIQKNLSTSIPLHVTCPLIEDGIYWKRCCEERWQHYDVSLYDNSWKRMFFETHLENIIELFIPGTTEPSTLLEVLPYCKNLVKRLNISQLLLPMKEPKQEKEESVPDLELKLQSEDDDAQMEHFDFDPVLNQLTKLEELHLIYRIKQCGMNYEPKMFRMTYRDCRSLANALTSHKNLKLLRVHQSRIEDKLCRLLVKALLDHPSLRVLDFSHNFIGDGGARAVGKLLNRSKLEALNMCNNKINELGAKAIAHALSKNPRLLSLNLRLNQVRDDGAQAICKALEENTTLTHLHLGGNDVTSLTASVLSQVLAENKTLRSINLSCNKLGEDGGKVLAEAMSNNTTVTEFDIRLAEVDEESASSIKKKVLDNQSFEGRAWEQPSS